MTAHFMYLHGFLSSPASDKARFLRERLAKWDIPLLVPDLNVPDFPHLTLTAQIEKVAEEIARCAPGPVYLVAASMGAQVALHFMERYKDDLAKRVEKILLLAPSFDFMENRRRQLGHEGLQRWKETGWLPIHHHDSDDDVALSYGLVEDIQRYVKYPTKVTVPIFALHGRQDTTVSFEQSVRFAETMPNVTLRLCNSNHSLSNQFETIWSIVVEFFELCKNYPAGDAYICTSYNMAEPLDVSGFAPYQDRFFDILREGYGTRYIGDATHTQRLFEEKRTVFLAFTHSVSVENLVGCSFVARSGKRSATAVVPEHRGRGVARRMICASLQLIPEQFTEISLSDQRMTDLIKSFGFRPVKSEEALRRYLHSYLPLLLSIERTEEGLVYRRNSSSRSNVQHEFMLYERVPMLQLMD